MPLSVQKLEASLYSYIILKLGESCSAIVQFLFELRTHPSLTHDLGCRGFQEEKLQHTPRTNGFLRLQTWRKRRGQGHIWTHYLRRSLGNFGPPPWLLFRTHPPLWCTRDGEGSNGLVPTFHCLASPALAMLCPFPLEATS